jgi:predicted RNA binding protein with dsRBD fold (UPF0201 family)
VSEPLTNNNNPTSLLSIKIDAEHVMYKRQTSHRKVTPKLFKNILIGSNVTSAFTCEMNANDAEQRPSGHKIMKRLHQLCADTAKKAINELKLMQRYFSTPYYLLKFNEIAKKTATITAGTKKDTDSGNLFWSLTLGDCVLSSFFTLEGNFNEDTTAQSKSLVQLKKQPATASILKQSQQDKFLSPIDALVGTTKKVNESTVYYDAPSTSDGSQLATALSKNVKYILHIKIKTVHPSSVKGYKWFNFRLKTCSTLFNISVQFYTQ